MTDDPNTLINQLGNLIAAEMPRPQGKEDWEYRDIPWLADPYWSRLFDSIGADNYIMLAGTQRLMQGVFFRRGQYFISPEGMKNITINRDFIVNGN